MNLQYLLSSRDQLAERRIISKVLTSKKYLPDILPEYFEGKERDLVLAIKEQWEAFGRVDPHILQDHHPEACYESLELQGTYSEAAIELVKKHWMQREIGRVLAGVGEVENPDETISEIQGKLAKIVFAKTEKYSHNCEVSQLLNAMANAQLKQGQVRGYSTNIAAIDGLTGGIEKGKVYAIGALKKTGKSRFGVYLSAVLKSQGAGIFWNSLEMSSLQLNSLALAYYSGINSACLGMMLPKEQYQILNECINYLGDLNWSIYKDHTVPNLKSRIIFEQQEKQIDIVFVDFIQRMRSDKYSKDRVREVEAIAQDLADLARDLNVAIIEFSQLSGIAEKLEPEEIPNMSHFKESQAIPENADSIWTLHCPGRHQSPYNANNEYEPQKFKVRIEQRYDISGGIASIKGDMRTCRFTDDLEESNGTT